MNKKVVFVTGVLMLLFGIAGLSSVRITQDDGALIIGGCILIGFSVK